MTRTTLPASVTAVMAAAVLGALPAAPAHAQQGDIAGAIDGLLNDALTLEGEAGAPPPIAAPAAEAMAPQAAADYRQAALRFEPDPAIRAKATEAFLATFDAVSPEAAAQLRQMDPFALIAQAFEPYGMSVNDFADTSAFHLIAVHDGANLAPVGEDTPVPVAKALSDQLAGTYASVNAPEMSDPAAVQAQSDAYALQALMFSLMHLGAMDSAFGDENRANYQKQMIATGQQVYGVDLSKATISEQGFIPGEAMAALQGVVDDERAKRAAENPEAEAERAMQAAFGTPCGRQPGDPTERKILNLLEKRSLCEGYDPARYQAFKAEVPQDQQYAINFVVWSTGNPLYPAEQAKMMDGMID